MKDKDKSREQLIKELNDMRKQLNDCMQAEGVCLEDRWRIQQYLDIAGVVIVALDTKGMVMLINEKGCNILGYKKSEIIGRNWFSNFIPPKTRPKVKDVFTKLMKGEIELFEYYENTVLVRSGGEKAISWRNALLRNERGDITGTLSSGLDITEYKKTHEDLLLAQCAMDRAAIGALWIGKDAQVLYVNDATCASLGYSREELLSMHVYDFDPDYPKKRWPGHWKELKERKSFTFESRNLRKDGSIFPIEVTVNYLEFYGKEYNFAFVKDITNRKTSEDTIRQSEARLRTAIESLPFDFFIIDEDGRYVMVNSTLKENWGDPTGKRIEDVAPDGKTLALWKSNNRRAFSGEIVTGDVTYKIKDKEGYYHNVISPIYEGKDICGILGVNIDITELKKAERKLEILNRHLINTNKKLQILALRDYHTGLYNYHYLEDIIDAEFYRAKRHENPLSLIIIDIDYFKSVNEIYGSQCGDLILKQFARQLKKIVRRYDVIIRLGGEEFSILCPSAGSEAAIKLANRILNSVATYSFGTKSQTIRLKLSIGVSTFPDIRALKGMDLVEAAENVLSKAKDDGGNRVYHTSYFKKPRRRKAGAPKAGVADMKKKLDRITKKANQNLIEAIFAFAKTIELKDHYTGEHVEKTVHYASELARTLRLPPEEVERIRQAAMLHDLGKIGISDKILLKKAKLSKKEFERIKKHPQIAADILRPIQVLHDIIPYIFYHHERWDGSGYPSGLKKEEIPMGARIIALADVYQALSSDRAYRKAYSKKKVREIIREGAGSQFDPKIVNVFLDILKKEEE